MLSFPFWDSACGETRDYFSPVFTRVWASTSRVIIIILVLPFTKLLIIISIKCQAFSPVKHILSPGMYVLHGRKCILYVCACTSIQKPLPQLGSTLCQTAFCIHIIFSSPMYWLTLSLPFLKNLLLSTVKRHAWAFPSFFEPFSGQSSN